MANSIRAFMRKRAKEEEIVKVKAPEGFGENGEEVIMEVKRLSTKKVNEIYDLYNGTRPAKDENGNYIIEKGRVVKEAYSDSKKNFDRLIVEALAFPDLHNKELMEFYGCVDVMEMPDKVFAKAEEYNYVRDVVLSLAGTLSGDESEYIIEEVKN